MGITKEQNILQVLQIFDKTIAAPNILINLAKETKTALKHALVCPCFFRQACRWPLVSYVCSAAPAPIPIVMAPLFPANTHYFNLESQRCHFLSPLWELLLVQISWSNSTSSWHKHHKGPGSGQRLAIRGANYLCPEYGFGLAPALTCQPQTERPRWTKTQLGILRCIFRGQLECICKGGRINENRFFVRPAADRPNIKYDLHQCSGRSNLFHVSPFEIQCAVSMSPWLPKQTTITTNLK